MRKILVGIALLLLPVLAFGQGATVIRGEFAAGDYRNIAADGGGRLIANTASADPCTSGFNQKQSVPINITTAVTTLLVAASASTVVYVCGFVITISQVITTPNTIKFVRGTGGGCGGGQTIMTGIFGDGGVTAGAPITVESKGNGYLFKGNAADAICAITTIGGSGSFQGVMTYVQI